MDTFSSFIPLKPRHRRKRHTVGSPPTPPPPAPLVLVSASYDAVGTLLTLVFDRAVNIDGLDGYSFLVDDAQETNFLYEGSGGAALLDPVTVELTLLSIGDAAGAGVVLSVSTLNGIVAVNDGGTWVGVSDLGLPFP